MTKKNEARELWLHIRSIIFQMLNTLRCEFCIEMPFLISELRAICGTYTAAINIVANIDAVVGEASVAINAEDVGAAREVSITPKSATLGFTHAPASVAIAAEICVVWHNFFVCVYYGRKKKL